MLLSGRGLPGLVMLAVEGASSGATMYIDCDDTGVLMLPCCPVRQEELNFIQGHSAPVPIVPGPQGNMVTVRIHGRMQMFHMQSLPVR